MTQRSGDKFDANVVYARAMIVTLLIAFVHEVTSNAGLRNNNYRVQNHGAASKMPKVCSWVLDLQSRPAQCSAD